MSTLTLRIPPAGSPSSDDASDTRMRPSRVRFSARWVLAGVLLAQALLSARTIPTADDDEALYIRSGHILWNGIQQGIPTTHWGMHSYFSGTPELYPVLASWIDSAFGLDGVRALSLVCMLSTTALLYLTTKHLLGTRVALWAAALFAVLPSVLELNVLATYDAPALALLALALWIVVRCDGSRLYLLAAPVLALAIAVKYASAMFLPAIAVLAALAALRRYGRWPWSAASRVVLLPALVAALIGAALALFGTAGLEGLESTTTDRRISTDATVSAGQVFHIVFQLAWWLLALACLGAVLFALKDASNKYPGRWCRICYGTVLCCTAVLVPAYQAHIHTTTALGKHTAFALMFAAPLAGIALDRMVVPYLPNVLFFLVGAGVVGLAVFGTDKATQLSHWYPDTTKLIQALKDEVGPDGKYLVDPNNPPKYYLADRTQPDQWTELTWIDYTDPQGHKLTGFDAYRTAIENGYFSLAVMNDHSGHDMSKRLIPVLEKSGKYHLLQTIPNEDNSGKGEFQIWGRK
jgi:4-amino-4-deoxy-L-arabinose transferase-like glycosyltransferase